LLGVSSIFKSVSADDATSHSTLGSIYLDSAIDLCAIASKQVLTTIPVAGYSGSQVDSDVVGTVNTAFTQARKLLSACACQIDASRLLPSTVHLLSSVDLILSTFGRVEGVVMSGQQSAKPTDFGNQSNSPGGFQINDKHYCRDGLLLNSAVLAPLIKFTVKESQRRDIVLSKSGLSASRNVGQLSNTSDVEELVSILQRSENHILACRVLLSCSVTGATKAQTLRSSLFALSRKLLTYHFIDGDYVTALLALLPYEAMVKELKTVIPTIQTDFKRLKVVASIGEELARMWNEDALLCIFQSLQLNSKWWQVLSAHGIPVDPKAFQSSDSQIRETAMTSAIPLLLEKSGHDLGMGLVPRKLFLTLQFCSISSRVLQTVQLGSRVSLDMSSRPAAEASDELS
jgi:hypothetical protein